jgi:hypothetical protein
MEAVKQGNDAQTQVNNDVLRKGDWLVAMALAGEVQYALQSVAQASRRKFTTEEMVRACFAAAIMTESSPEDRAKLLAEAEVELAPLIASAMEIKKRTGVAPKMEFDARKVFTKPGEPEPGCTCLACTFASIIEKGKPGAPSPIPMTSASVTFNGTARVFTPNIVPFNVLGNAAGVVNPKVVVTRGAEKREVPIGMLVELQNGDQVDVTPAPPLAPVPTV